MENQVIVLETVPQVVHDFVSKPNGIAKTLEYKRNSEFQTRVYYHTSLKIEDGIAYFSQLAYKVQKRKNNVYYLARHSKDAKGFTVNKRGTIQVWWNGNFSSFSNNILSRILTAIKADWLYNDRALTCYLSKSNFGKVLVGKITNPTDFIKCVIKSNKIDVSPAMFRKFIDIMRCDSSSLYKNNASTVMSLLKTAVNANAFIEKLYNYHKIKEIEYTESMTLTGSHTSIRYAVDDRQVIQTDYNYSPTYCAPAYRERTSYKPLGFLEEGEGFAHILHDMLEQADILGRKIDLLWSEKRMNEEHNKWSEELLEYEIQDKDDQNEYMYQFASFFKDFEDEFTSIVNTERKGFEEGKKMHHCFYTSYWDRVKKGNYLTYHTTYEGVQGTLSIRFTYRSEHTAGGSKVNLNDNLQSFTNGVAPFVIDQFYGIRNAKINDDIYAYYHSKVEEVCRAFCDKLQKEKVITCDKTVKELEEAFEW